MTTTPLQPTARTRVRRGRHRSVEDREHLLAFLREAFVAHLGVVVDGYPLVLPAAYAVDPQGPDPDGTLYVHGSGASVWLRRAVDRTVCVTVTELDGLVVSRSPFHHSMNYRSAVVLGTAREVGGPDERGRALDLIVDHMLPGRAATLRASTRKELAATAVLAVPLHEASMKERAGGPVEDPADLPGGWGGHIPVRRLLGPPVPDPDAVGDLPPDVVARAGREVG